MKKNRTHPTKQS